MGKSTKRVANAYTFCATKRWEKTVNKRGTKSLHFSTLFALKTLTLFALKMLQKRLHFFTLFALAKRLHFFTQSCQHVFTNFRKSRVFVKTSKQCLGNTVCRHTENMFSQTLGNHVCL